MEGLDLLKQHWDKGDGFPRVDKAEIGKMLHRKSSSIVKWIFIISLIELALGIILSFTLPASDEEHSSFFIIVEVLYSVVFYSIILYFIYQFFNNYKQIKTTNNTKVLLGTILKTRQYVDYYIRFNIYCIIFSFAIVSIEKLFDIYQTKSIGEFIFAIILVTILMSLFCWVFLLIVKLYYRLLYRRMVKKLNENYEELLKIENGEQA